MGPMRPGLRDGSGVLETSSQLGTRQTSCQRTRATRACNHLRLELPQGLSSIVAGDLVEGWQSQGACQTCQSMTSMKQGWMRIGRAPPPIRNGALPWRTREAKPALHNLGTSLNHQEPPGNLFAPNTWEPLPSTHSSPPPALGPVGSDETGAGVPRSST